MTRVEDLLPDDEARRAVECAREEIRLPGAIQPHGVLLAVDPRSLVVAQVSTTSTDLLGRAPEEVVGEPLTSVLGEIPGDALRAVMATPAPQALVVTVGGRRFDAVGHRSADGLGILELEPLDPSADDLPLGDLHAAMQRLSRATSVPEVRARAVREVRRLTGFDRVMIYHFHPDGHGEVVAEDRAEHLEPYLGLHYPASDIPAQARRLYVLQGSRTIPAARYEAAPLVPAENPLTGAPTDLGRAELRSVSPHHLQYMANMGVAASMSVSLVHEGELIGMISCNHQTPRRTPYAVRRACEILAQQLALQTRALLENRRLDRRLQLQPTRNRIVAWAAARTDLAAAVAHGEPSATDLVPADGLVVRLDGRVATVGEVPPPAQVAALVDLVATTGAGGGVLATDALRHDRPDLAAIVPEVVGVLAVPVGDRGDHVVWLRRAIAQNVDWLGEQGSANRDTPLSPRNSFRMWRQTVTDRAQAWDDVEVAEAVELARDLARTMAQERERRMTARAELTADVAAALAETLEAEQAVGRLARLVVPALADWCVISLVDDGDAAAGRPALRDVGTWHVEPHLRPLVEEYARHRLSRMRPESFVARALAAGAVSTRPSGATAVLAEMVVTDEAREVLRHLAPDAFAVLPLRARNRTLGVLSLYNGADRGPVTPEELAVAREVADRAGLALDNTRLYREQRTLAEGLQRSLLTDPPDISGIEVAVRYVPAAEAARVGGDWYDAFPTAAGTTTLVIGDVVGHDVTAAAAMGQLRSLVRGIAVATDAGPAELLGSADRTMRTLAAATIATAVAARVDVVDGADAGHRLVWSNAGHPDPVVLLPDGTVDALGSAERDLLLGVLADTERRETQRVLPAGTVVLFYTDGLVERRDSGLLAGMERLAAVVRVAGSGADAEHPVDLDVLCDEVLAGMLPEHPEDDVALLAVRLGLAGGA